MHNVAQLKTKVQRWAEEITSTYGASVAAIIAVGDKLIQAKAECSPGEWGELTGETTGKPLLPFSARTARRLKAIASNAAFSNRAHAPDLKRRRYWQWPSAFAPFVQKMAGAACRLSRRSIHPTRRGSTRL